MHDRCLADVTNAGIHPKCIQLHILLKNFDFINIDLYEIYFNDEIFLVVGLGGEHVMNACQGAEWIMWYCPFLSQWERWFNNHTYISKNQNASDVIMSVAYM